MLLIRILIQYRNTVLRQDYFTISGANFMNLQRIENLCIGIHSIKL